MGQKEFGHIMAMTIEQANGNWNFLYEFQIGDNWYPCNILDEVSRLKDHLYIFTRNGTICQQSIKELRKRSKTDYLRDREAIIEWYKELAYLHGFHENVNDDLDLFYNASSIQNVC